VFGRIAAVHALSDVVAAGATPHSAQVLLSLPFADKRIVKRDMQQLMAGVADALSEDRCSLIGGHTSEATTLSLGFVVNGFLDSQLRGSTMSVNVGDHLILTKPLGSGVLLAGMMRQLARGVDVQHVLDQMQQSNRAAATVLHQYSPMAVTDVTGFGLLGHLNRLLTSLRAGAVLQVPEVPIYNGALALAEQGVCSTLLDQNQHVFAKIANTELPSSSWQNLLCDPQTSGGLLGIVSAKHSETVLTKLHNHGFKSACKIGKIIDKSGIQLSF